MPKEISAGSIRGYLYEKQQKQGLSHARMLLERFWINNKTEILATTGSVRQGIMDLFADYGMVRLAQKLLGEWDREKDPEYLVSQVLTLDCPMKQSLSIASLLESGGLGRGSDEPMNLLIIANETLFHQVAKYIARLMKRRQSEPNYIQYGFHIDRLLEGRRAIRAFYDAIQFVPQHDEPPYDHDEEDAPLSIRELQRLERRQSAERLKNAQNNQHGRKVTDRSLNEPHDGNDFYETIITGQGGSNDFYDANWFHGNLEPESNHQYHARQWKYYIQGRPYQGGDRQRASKFKARRRREDEMRRQEKSYE